MRIIISFLQLPLLLWLYCFFFFDATTTTTLATSAPKSLISNVQVTLKGKKYDIENVTTLKDLQERIHEASGIAPSQQGRILFQGKSLQKGGAESLLQEAGVSDGAVLNCVPSTSSSSTTSSTSTAGGGKKNKNTATVSSTTTTTTKTATTTSSSSPDEASSLQEMMQSAGVDTKAMEDMVNQMMGGGGGVSGNNSNGAMPSMQESMEAMANMMKSPLLTEYMNDPEKLEQSRQMILQNPMLRSMMGGMPGMEELLNDPAAWAAAMRAAADMYSQMDPNDLMNAMMQGAEASMGGGGTMMPPGLFDGMNGPTAAATTRTTTTTTTALDELSEDDD
ncbi:ubiquitin family protein [Nitzschia inconspicua]|uniref:Ubiquitin family protein n=1 Tax=Nitzschia inconspicua TaxID=303405 RepID=A0A9K3P8S7_9STRA|nr:ubiquitin family protein [Nitzschia inconspicua]KAG7371663.1 ubiquitin family protein [Nitzschia inconspicua]